MVAHLLKLRLLVLKNSLLRHPVQLVVVILAGIYGLGMLGLAAAGLFALSWAPLEFARTVVVLAGSAAVLAWIVVPLLSAGVDQTLDPARLVTFPIPLDRLLLALAVCGVLGIPGVLTLLGALATVGTWWRHPAAAVAAVVCAAVGVLICVVGSRAVVALSASVSGGRRFRELSGVIIVIPFVLLGPIIVAVASGIRNAGQALPGLADALAWTPLGAVWVVPADIVGGRYGMAGLRFLIAIATLAVLVLVWRRSLATALVTPSRPSAGRAVRGRLGFFTIFPATPAGAVAARSLTYWMRDPRYLRQLIVVPVVLVLLGINSANLHSSGFFTVAGPVLALFLSLSIFADVSYDGTAFAAHMSSGITGRADRLGRIAAVAVFAVPIVLIATVVPLWMTGAWSLLPGLLGLAVGVLLSGFGVGGVTSARLVIPVPASGDSPFKSNPGGFASAIAMFASWGIVVGLVLPELVLTIVAAVTGQMLFGWIALVVGVVLGSVFLVAGIRIGGALLDRRAPELLVQLRRQY